MRFLTILLCLAFFSCRVKNNIPNNVLSQEDMRTIMWDLMRADKFVSDFVARDSSVDRKRESYILYGKIYQLHGITEDKFKQSLAFYQGRPDLLKTITDSLRTNEREAMEHRFDPVTPINDSTFRKPAPGVQDRE